MALAQATEVTFGTMEHDSSQPIEVTSDQLNVDQTAGTALFTGDVFAQQGDLKLWAKEVLVFYVESETEAGRIDRIEATGEVVLVLNDEAAEGDNGVYNVRDGIMVMEGNVLLTQGPSTVAGDHLTVHLDTGTGEMEGRVRTMLRPAGAGADE